MKTKTVDAVDMKRQGAENIYRQIAQMTPTQQLLFWQQRTLALQARQQAAKTRRTTITT
jgi:hypothetical protein